MFKSNQLKDKIIESIDRPEIKLFLYASRLHIDAPIATQIKTLLQTDINWDYLIETTINFGIPPLFYWNLISQFSSHLPADVSTRLRNIYLINSVKSTAYADTLLKVLAQYHDHGIKAIPFKGPVLSISAYGNLGMRIFSDLDILVRPQDFDKAKNILLDQGYQSKQNEINYESDNLQASLYQPHRDGSIDIHYGIPPKELEISTDIFFASLEVLSLSGQPINVLKPEAHLLILCVNGSKESWRLFGKICDIAALLQTHQQLDWDWIEDQAQQQNIRRIVYFALFLAHTFFDTDIPDTIRVACESNLLMRWLAMKVGDKIFPKKRNFMGFRLMTYIVYIFYIHQPKPSNFIRLMLSPNPADREFLPLPPSLCFLYYLIRPFRLMYQHVFSAVACLNPVQAIPQGLHRGTSPHGVEQ